MTGGLGVELSEFSLPQSLRRLPGVLPGGRMTGGGCMDLKDKLYHGPYVGCRGSVSAWSRPSLSDQGAY